MGNSTELMTCSTRKKSINQSILTLKPKAEVRKAGENPKSSSLRLKI